MASNKVFITKALNKIKTEFGHLFQLKTKQEQTVNCLLGGRDVFTVMPTGYGKSLVFQIFLMTMNCTKIAQAMEPNSIVLVICPLTSIIGNQIKEGESLGLKCVTLDEFLNDCDCDTPQVVFVSAEQVLSKTFTEILKDRSSRLHNALELVSC
jgi:superfamily II DNA helicase RecQ